MKKLLLLVMLISTGCASSPPSSEFKLYFNNDELKGLARKSITDGDYKETWDM